MQHSGGGEPMQHSDERIVSLFRNKDSQALRIPKDFEFPGTKVLLRREGARLVIEPAPKKGLAALLASWEPLPPEDRFPDKIEDFPLDPEEKIF